MFCVFRKKSACTPTWRNETNQYVSTPHLPPPLSSSSTVQHTSSTQQNTLPTPQSTSPTPQSTSPTSQSTSLTPQKTSTNYVNIIISNASAQHNPSNRSNQSSTLDLSERIYENTNSPFLSAIRNQAKGTSADHIPEHDYENTNTIQRNLKRPHYPYADLVFEK